MNYLLIGAGSIGSRHVRNLIRIDKHAQIHVLTRNGSKNPYLKSLILEFGQQIHTHTSLQTVDLNSVDGAFICTPSAHHEKNIMDIAKHVHALFVEKPLTLTLGSTKRIARYCQKHHTTLYVGYCLRYHPALLAVQKILATGQLGVIQYAHAHCSSLLSDWRAKGSTRASYSAQRAMGGGVTLDLSHEFDYLVWLFGQPQNVIGTKRRIGALTIDADDTCDALFLYPDKTISVHLDYLDANHRRSLTIHATKATLTVDLKKSHIIIEYVNGRVSKKTFTNFDANQMYVEELKNWLGHIKRHRNPKFLLDQDVFAVQNIIDAIKWQTDR